jgi:hypothetical protein
MNQKASFEHLRLLPHSPPVGARQHSPTKGAAYIVRGASSPAVPGSPASDLKLPHLSPKAKQQQGAPSGLGAPLGAGSGSSAAPAATSVGAAPGSPGVALDGLMRQLKVMKKQRGLAGKGKPRCVHSAFGLCKLSHSSSAL